jgi:hypothetical protein
VRAAARESYSTIVKTWLMIEGKDVYVHDGDVVDVYPPIHHRYRVKAWEASRIIAEYDFSCGGPESGRETWVIDRKRKAAELFGYPCTLMNEAPNEVPAPWHYTLEFSR